VVAVGVIVAVFVAAGGIAFARDRVQDNAKSQLLRKIDHDAPAVQRLAGIDADDLVDAHTAPLSDKDLEDAVALADRLWLLSPRLSGTLRSDARDTARTVDEAVFEMKVLDLVTSGNRNLEPAAALAASRSTYETRARPGNTRLPEWDTIVTNPTMRQAERQLDRLEQRLRS
jgi:hypothetical protein